MLEDDIEIDLCNDQVFFKENSVLKIISLLQDHSVVSSDPDLEKVMIENERLDCRKSKGSFCDVDQLIGDLKFYLK